MLNIDQFNQEARRWPPNPRPISLDPSEITPPLAVLTDKNKLTITEGALANFPDADCFEVAVENGRIVLTPYEITTIEGIQAKIAALGITEDDIAYAIEWARGRWMW